MLAVSLDLKHNWQQYFLPLYWDKQWCFQLLHNTPGGQNCPKLRSAEYLNSRSDRTKPMTTVGTKCYPTVCYFSIVVVKYPSQSNSREKVYFGSQFEVVVHLGGEATETRSWSNWLHCIHSQTHWIHIVSRASAHPSLSSISTLFSPGIPLPGGVPSTVTMGPLLGGVMHTSGGKGSRSLWVLGQPMQHSEFQFSKNLKCQIQNFKKDGHSYIIWPNCNDLLDDSEFHQVDNWDEPPQEPEATNDNALEGS